MGLWQIVKSQVFKAVMQDAIQDKDDHQARKLRQQKPRKPDREARRIKLPTRNLNVAYAYPTRDANEAIKELLGSRERFKLIIGRRKRK